VEANPEVAETQPKYRRAHFRAMEHYIGALKDSPEAKEVHPGSVEALSGALEPHPRAAKAHPEP
jgi:hypothetical protein